MYLIGVGIVNVSSICFRVTESKMIYQLITSINILQYI